MRAPLSKDDEREAAAHYWGMQGHNLSAEERIERHEKFTADAPRIRPQHHRTTA